jgi:hypothetical protein
MKESTFIELLNLYLDHEISARDAERLESEIQQNPDRRRIYRQYCRMQKACAVLGEKFRTQVPVTEEKVVVFPRLRRRAAPLAIGVTGLAAAVAACVALVLVNRPRLDQEVTIPLASAPTPQAQRPIQPANAESARPAPLQPAFAGLVRPNGVPPASFAADRASFDWMDRVQFQQVPLEQLRFSTQPVLQSEDLSLRSRRPFQGQVEMTAFRYQK